MHLSVFSLLPFIFLLLSIALLPLIAPHFWHRNRNRALVAALFSLPVVLYLLYLHLATGQDTISPLVHEMTNYVFFILLLGSLFTVSGGIVLEGALQPRPTINTVFLASGSILANLIGTTGASVFLIHPILRINRPRKYVSHIPIFFIFTVSNLGGLLTPLGDPPLFLGFLNGVPFVWTLALWPEWLLVNGLVLLVFFAWDSWAFRREDTAELEKGLSLPPGRGEGNQDSGPLGPNSLRVRGLVNIPLLAGIMGAVLLQRLLPGFQGEAVGAGLMLLTGFLSMILTPRALRALNGFTWEPILEVAILFAGIFATMVPALEFLKEHSRDFGVSQPSQFFWLTGTLSAFLDNAPTYMTFATLAAGSKDFSLLVADQVQGLNGPQVLQALSCGAVFFGAMTYIGNGPNFMVKAIAEEAGFAMPSFFGYLAYSCLILLPLFGLVTVVFFR